MSDLIDQCCDLGCSSRGIPREKCESNKRGFESVHVITTLHENPVHILLEEIISRSLNSEYFILVYYVLKEIFDKAGNKNSSGDNTTTEIIF